MAINLKKNNKIGTIDLRKNHGPAVIIDLVQQDQDDRFINMSLLEYNNLSPCRKAEFRLWKQKRINNGTTNNNKR